MTLFLDITKIGDESVPFDHELDLSHLARDDSALLDVGDVRVTGRAVRGERGVDLQARLTATVALSCGRCLDRFEITISEDFYLTAVAEAMKFGSGETEVTEEDSDLLHAPDGKVDFRDIAQEQLYLNLPLKAVCRGDCSGLCPTCGVNRNRIECGCQSQDLDPRLAPLLDLKKKLGDH